MIFVTQSASEVPIAFVAVSPISFFTFGLEARPARSLASMVLWMVVTFQTSNAEITSVDERRHTGDDVIVTLVMIEVNLLIGRGTFVDDGVRIVFGRHYDLVIMERALK